MEHVKSKTKAQRLLCIVGPFRIIQTAVGCGTEFTAVSSIEVQVRMRPTASIQYALVFSFLLLAPPFSSFVLSCLLDFFFVRFVFGLVNGAQGAYAWLFVLTCGNVDKIIVPASQGYSHLRLRRRPRPALLLVQITLGAFTTNC